MFRLLCVAVLYLIIASPAAAIVHPGDLLDQQANLEVLGDENSGYGTKFAPSGFSVAWGPHVVPSDDGFTLGLSYVPTGFGPSFIPDGLKSSNSPVGPHYVPGGVSFGPHYVPGGVSFGPHYVPGGAT